MARKKNFLRGALVLTAGMALVKVIGALFKIPLKYAIGEYGMGLFNVAYNFYGPVFSLATAGFPIAVSRMVSESRSLGRWNDVRQIRRAAFPLFLAFGGAGMLLLTALAPLYCERVIGSQEALAPVLALAPAILFACICSVYRGYYEGLQDMAPTAVSEVVEALVKLCLGLGLSRWVVSSRGAEYETFGTVFSLVPDSPDGARFLILSFAAAGAVLGVTLGSAGSLLYLALRSRLLGDGVSRRLCQSAPPPRSRRETARRLLKITVPVALGSVATNAAGLIDATLLQGRLGRALERESDRLLARFPGMIPDMYLENPESIPTFLYGCYTLAMTVYLLVPALAQAIGVSALPAVTEAWAARDRRTLCSRIRAVCRVTALFAFPAGLGISALADPIVRVLYGGEGSSAIVAGSLRLLGIASLAAALCVPLSSMLQAVGRADLPVKLLCGAMAVKVAVSWALCGLPEWNVTGAAVGTLLSYLLLAVAQLWFLQRESGIRLSFGKLFAGPLCCGGVCALAAWACYEGIYPVFAGQGFGMVLSLGAAVLCGALVYGASLALLGAVEPEDLALLPGGEKLARFLPVRPCPVPQTRPREKR